MDRACLNKHIINIKCKHKSLGNTLSTQLSAGSRKVVCLDRYNIATGYLLDILSCYKPFEGTVTYAHKFTFERPDLNESPLTSARVDMIMKDNVLIYNGTGNGEEMAIYFENQIDLGGLTVSYEVERIGNVLYVYSYDPLATFNDTSSLISSVNQVTVGSTSLKNDLSEITNLWNNLSEKELCNLITFATNASKTGETLSASSGNGGCNC